MEQVARGEETQLCVWGNNMFGQLGFEKKNKETLIASPKLLSFMINIVDISCGYLHSLFKTKQGQIFSVGCNNKGQLGIGRQIKARTAPTLVSFPAAKEKILSVGVQGYHNIVYSELGRFYTWGDNARGQLGCGTAEAADFPVEITKQIALEEDEAVVQIACGLDNTAVLLNSGRCLAWGSNENHKSAVSRESAKDQPRPAVVQLENIQKVALGYSHSLWLDYNGDIFATGSNKDECVLLGQPAVLKAPTKMDLPEKCKKIFAGGFSAAITASDNLILWGFFLNQVLPPYFPFEAESQSRVSANSSKLLGPGGGRPRVVSVGIGKGFLVASDDKGDCYSWGSNEVGQLGKTSDEAEDKLKTEEAPRKLEILDSLDIYGISVGPDFVYTIVSERPEEVVEEESFQYNSESQLPPAQKQGPEKEEQQFVVSPGLRPRKPSSPEAEKFLEVSRVLVYLYEDLRSQLISVIDDNARIQGSLTPEVASFVRAQQDVIDSYLLRFNLKRILPVGVTEKTLFRFKYPECLPLAVEMAKAKRPTNIRHLFAADVDGEKTMMYVKTLTKFSKSSAAVEERVQRLRAILESGSLNKRSAFPS